MFCYQRSHTLGKSMVGAELGSGQTRSGYGPYLSRAVKWEVRLCLTELVKGLQNGCHSSTKNNY